MTSHYFASGDRQGGSPPGSPSYDSQPYAVFPDGSVVWEHATEPHGPDRNVLMPVPPATVAAARPLAGLQGVVLGVAIALISASFGALLPWLVVATTSPLDACPDAASPLPGRRLNHRPQLLLSMPCHARR